MSRRLTRAVIAAAFVVTVGGLTACSTADTAPNQIALQYQNGPFSSRVFVSCVPQSTLQYHKINNDHYYYPEGQRTLTFGPDGDFPALSITSTEGQVMAVNANMTFHLNTSCQPYTDAQGRHWPGGVIQKFHETIAAQDQAYATDGGGEPGPGWDKVLQKYLQAPTERGVSNQALGFGWNALFTDPATKARWETESKTEIPKLVKEQTGEDYFVIDNILLQKPAAPPILQGELANNQAAHLRANTAATDQQTAANFPGGIAGYTAYQLQLAIARAIDNGKVTAVPVPVGSPVIIGGGK